MEAVFGTSFADVRVHVGPQAASIGALAYTQGSHIYFAPGQYDPSSPQGRQLLGHELTHVVQQRAGRVRNPFGTGIAVVQDRSMEAEADRIGLKAAAAQPPVPTTGPGVRPSASDSSARSVAPPGGSGAIQRQPTALGELVMDTRGPTHVHRRILGYLGDDDHRRLRQTSREMRARTPPALADLRLGRPRLSLAQYQQPTFLLAELTGQQAMGGWSGGHAALSGAHHIFPKSVLAWLYDHMTVDQRRYAFRQLFLPQGAGAKALARFRSNLISPLRFGQTIRPEMRTDDPHHHRGHAPLGEEYLDLVRTEGGQLEVRSRIYRQLAFFVIRYLYPRYRAEGEDFRLTNLEVKVLTSLLKMAEALHYHLEADPLSPAFSGGGIWVQSDRGFQKAFVPVRRLTLTDETLIRRYRAKKRAEARRLASLHDTRMQIVDRWFDWLGKPSRDQESEDIKSDWIKGIPMFIHGRKRGQRFRPEDYGLEPFKYGGYAGEFKTTLIRIHQREVDPNAVDWFQALFEYA